MDSTAGEGAEPAPQQEPPQPPEPPKPLRPPPADVILPIPARDYPLHILVAAFQELELPTPDDRTASGSFTYFAIEVEWKNGTRTELKHGVADLVRAADSFHEIQMIYGHAKYTDDGQLYVRLSRNGESSVKAGHGYAVTAANAFEHQLLRYESPAMDSTAVAGAEPAPQQEPPQPPQPPQPLSPPPGDVRLPIPARDYSRLRPTVAVWSGSIVGRFTPVTGFPATRSCIAQ